MVEHPVLVCTVGGSAAPIITAVEARAEWAEIVFVCSGSATAGEASSRDLLPEIASSCALPAHRVVVVPPDDVDAAFGLLIEVFDTFAHGRKQQPVIADFTGGTKSMSAALVLASVGRPGVTLQNVTGPRTDLVKVASGSEGAVALRQDLISVHKRWEAYASDWHDFSYGPACRGFTNLREEVKDDARYSDEVKSRLLLARTLSEAMDKWDRFDHRGALRALQFLKRRGEGWLPNGWEEWVTFAEELAPAHHKVETLLTARGLFDLWRNAERRAAQERYDDAMARVYRLWEAATQWLLYRREGLRTDKILASMVNQPQNVRSDGTVALAAEKARELLCQRLPACIAARFWSVDENRKAASNFGHMRNHSILAHGSRPVSKEDWLKVQAWTEGPFLEMVCAEAQTLGEASGMDQLPNSLPEFGSG
jgi:CRISPR-associated protein (TIGR02710 family)